MCRRLIVNADDFGRSPGVSRGILEAHRQGIVTSTTVMINQPGVEAQLVDALACPSLGVGLHLVFTSGQSILPPAAIPSLVDQGGQFFDQQQLWSWAERTSTYHLRAELRAQVGRFTALAGHLPDHLDCHHFVHLHPRFFQVYVDLAVEFNLPLRVPIPPETDFRLAVATLPFLEGFPHDRVRGMVVTNSAHIQARRLIQPDRFISTFFGQAALTLEHLLHLLDVLPSGTSELMCHPGYSDRSLASSSYRIERETELALLTHPTLRERVEQQTIELVTFSTLGQNSVCRTMTMPEPI